MFALEMNRETQLNDIRVEKEQIELAREKEKLKQDQLLTQKLELEVLQLRQAMNIQPVLTVEEYMSCTGSEDKIL